MIPTFRNFILNENNKSYLKKINFLINSDKITSLTGKNNKRIYGEINDNCLVNLFNVYFAKDDNKDKQIDNNLPMIYYGGNQKESLEFLKNKKVPTDVMYNTPEEMKISGNKTDFYKMFNDYSWLPNSVFNIKDIDKLNFPIIGKPDSEHSGLGIEIFDNKEDAEKSKLSFDNFSEAKDIKQEFRVILVNNKICLVNERISAKENEIKDKKPDEQTEFIYVDQELNKLTFLDEVLKISKDIRKEIKLGLWSIDIMVDIDGNLWVAEINSASGMAADKMAKVYIMIYEDFFDEKLPKEFKEYLFEEYIKPIYKINLSKNKKMIEKSKHRVKYYK